MGTRQIVKMQSSVQGHAVWAYLVVSSERQAETLEDQEAWAKRTAHEHGWTITRTFKEPSTGKEGARDLLDRMLAELKSLSRSTRPSRILMTRLDRLGRGDSLDPIARFAEIRALGPVVFTRDDGDNTVNRASDAIKPIMRIFGGAMENEARRDKASEKWRNWKAAGRKGTRRPYGIVTDARGHDVALEPQAEFIREAFRRRIAGQGHLTIGNYLRDNAPPMPVKNGRKRGPEHRLRWTRGTVPQILRNPAYRGVVVPEEIWDEAQFVQNFVRPTTIRSWEWPLSGAIRCYCGYAMTGLASGGGPCKRCKDEPSRHNHQRVRYYVCWERHHTTAEPSRSSRAKPTPEKPHMRFVRAEVLESFFGTLLRSLAASPQLVARYASQKRLSHRSRTALEQRVRALAEKVEGAEIRRSRVWTLHEQGLVRDADLQARLDAIAAETADAKAQLTRLRAELAQQERIDQAAASASAFVERAAEIWDNADIEDRRIIAGALAKYCGGITVTEDGTLKPGRLR